MYVCFKYKKTRFVSATRTSVISETKEFSSDDPKFHSCSSWKVIQFSSTLGDFNILHVSVDSNWFAQREMFTFVER